MGFFVEWPPLGDTICLRAGLWHATLPALCTCPTAGMHGVMELLKVGFRAAWRCWISGCSKLLEGSCNTQFACRCQPMHYLFHYITPTRSLRIPTPLHTSNRYEPVWAPSRERGKPHHAACSLQRISLPPFAETSHSSVASTWRACDYGLLLRCTLHLGTLIRVWQTVPNTTEASRRGRVSR